jgi:hypothetical protein
VSFVSVIYPSQSLEPCIRIYFEGIQLEAGFLPFGNIPDVPVLCGGGVLI